jgi:putative DNA primase/helicase
MSTNLLPPDGVPLETWLRLAKPNERAGRWEIPERNASGEVIGMAYRLADGSKDFKPGGKRGLILAWPLPAYAGSSASDPVIVTEGASDAGAMMGTGFEGVVGVPMTGHGGPMLADLLADRHVVLVADADEAGRRGSEKIAAALAERCASVRIIEPPGGHKDAREAVVAGATRADFEALIAEGEPMKPTASNASTNSPKSMGGEPVIVRLADVKPEPVAWLWPGRIALGKLTLIAGDPGLGKSFVTLDMAARVSTGCGWPDRPGVSIEPGGVVLLSAEDGIADTIRPRLDAAGADVARIVALEAIRAVCEHGRESARTFDLSRDLLALESAIRSVDGCRLVVIDPVTAYLGGVDSHKNAEIRGLLAPLSAIAERHRVAVVAVTHLNKSGAGPAIYRAMGSLAFAAAARAAWAVSKDKDDPKRRLLLPIKNNIAPDTGGLAYRIEPTGVGGCPVVAWEPDPVNVSADDALAGDRDQGGGGGALDEAMEWLRDTLSDGPCPAKDVKAAAESDGIKLRTLDRAKKSLGVKADREGYASEGRWVWAMPHSAPTDPKDAKPQGLAHNGKLGAQSNADGGWGEL